MNEGRKVHRGSFVAHSEAAEVLQPRIGALNDPSVSVPLQFPSVLMGGDLVAAAGRDDLPIRPLLSVGSSNFTSAGVAGATSTPSRVPAPSATTMSFVPLPFLVVPTNAPLF
jgi:hypothetical protein